MTKTRRPTVATSWLLHEADSVARYADQSLRAWVLLGTTERYQQEMTKVRALRAAAEEKSIHIRREILRNAGYEA